MPSVLSLPILKKCHRIFKILHLVEFSADWLAHSLTNLLTYLLIPSDKCNLITAKIMGLIFTLFDVPSSWDMPFCNCSSFNTCIMVLPKYTLVLLPFSSAAYVKIFGTCIMVLVWDLGTSRGTSYIILSLQCYPKCLKR